MHLEAKLAAPELCHRPVSRSIVSPDTSRYDVVVQTLLVTGKVDPDAKGNEGRTPLWWAATRKHNAVVQTLLATGKIEPDATDDDGRTPLWWAAARGHDAVVQTSVLNSRFQLVGHSS